MRFLVTPRVPLHDAPSFTGWIGQNMRNVRNGFAVICLAVAFVLSFPASPALSQTSQPPLKSSSPDLTPAQRLAIEKLIGEYLRENPDVVIDAIRTFQARQQAQQQQRGRATVASLKKELEADPTSPVVGNPDGDVTIVEFFDYRCTFCKRVFPSIRELLKTDKNVRYVLKEFPILSPESELATRAALIVWKYDKQKYFAFHSDLMAAKGGLSESKIMRFAAKRKLNVARIRREMNSQEVSAVIKRNFDLARKLGIRGTPGFVIAGTLVPGAIDLRTLRRMIADARKTGEKPKLPPFHHLPPHRWHQTLYRLQAYPRHAQ